MTRYTAPVTSLLRTASAVLLLGCHMAAEAAAADGPPPAPPPVAPQEPPPPTPDAAGKEPLPPAPPPLPGPTAEARAVIERAARRQGTLDRRGESAVRRFQVAFSRVVVLSPKGDKVDTESVETFAQPDRVRSEWTLEGRRQILGHSGRIGWLKSGEEPVKRFSDPEGADRENLRDVDLRRRMLGMTQRVFFLGNLLEPGPEVRLLPEETLALPRFNGEVEKRRCTVLRRAVHLDAGEPALTLFLDATTLDPVAARLEPSGEGAPAFLVTFDPAEEGHFAKGKVPEGLRVPGFLEVFEIPADPAAKPAPRITATLASLVIDPAALPDSLFQPPR